MRFMFLAIAGFVVLSLLVDEMSTGGRYRRVILGFLGF